MEHTTEKDLDILGMSVLLLSYKNKTFNIYITIHITTFTPQRQHRLIYAVAILSNKAEVKILTFTLHLHSVKSIKSNLTAVQLSKQLFLHVYCTKNLFLPQTAGN